MKVKVENTIYSCQKTYKIPLNVVALDFYTPFMDFDNYLCKDVVVLQAD